MKFYNFETIFAEIRDALRSYLHDNGIYYELSKAFTHYHFEIKATPEQADAINHFLDSLPDCFTEQA